MQNLVHRHDRLSMATSVELRVPFLENEIIDFALHLPARFKNRYRVTKWLLKKVARKYLPSENIRSVSAKTDQSICGLVPVSSFQLYPFGWTGKALMTAGAIVCNFIETKPAPKAIKHNKN